MVIKDGKTDSTLDRLAAQFVVEEKQESSIKKASRIVNDSVRDNKIYREKVVHL